jgi:hypothetical protein
VKKLLVLIGLIPAMGLAQTKTDIYNPQVPIVFFGIDFTKVQFTKSGEFTNKSEILRFFVDANNEIDHGSLRNLVEKGLDRKTIIWDFSNITAQNSKVDWQTVYSDNIEYTVSDEEIRNVVKNLNVDQGKYKNHIGMFLVEENCCKTKPLQTISCVFFNVNNLNVIFVKRYEMKPGGIGFYNYWSVNHNLLLSKLSKLKKEIE